MARKPRKKSRVDPMVGKYYGKLYVMRRMPNKKSGAPNTRARVLCQCKCGNRIIIAKAYVLRKFHPRRNCGACGRTLPMSPGLLKPEFHIWLLMKTRCSDEKHVSYKEYGGRGITVCNEWADPKSGFDKFLSSLGLRPPETSLDRIDANGNYEPGNVRWATAIQQARNKRTTKYVKHPKTGKKIAFASLAEELEQDYHKLRKEYIAAGKW